MKKAIFCILIIICCKAKSQQLYSIWISPVDSAMWVINASTGDSIQVTKLPRTLYQGIGSGTAYNITATPALVAMGTTSPTVTIVKSGTYLIMWNVRTDYAGATIAVSRSMVYKVRRTNNTATDINVSGFSTPVITALSFSGPDISRQFVYTATAGDILQIWANISTIPTLGNVSIPEANIIALRLY